MGDAGVGLWGRDAVTGRPIFGGATGVGVNQGTAATSSQQQGTAATAGASSQQQDATRTYSLRGVYFKRDQFSSVADCLTAAYAERLPLEVCQ